MKVNEEDEESRYSGEQFKEERRERRRKKETRREPNRLEISRLLPARRSACKSRLFVLTLETRKKEKRKEGRGGRGTRRSTTFIRPVETFAATAVAGTTAIILPSR